jgi:tetratricopeptide (TPR) repeat protein
MTDSALAYAATMLASGKPQDALAHAGPVLAREPDNQQALVIAAEAHAQLNDTLSAVEAVTRAITLAPHESGLWILASRVYIGGRDYRRALDSAKRAVHIAPGDWLAHAQVARVGGAFGSITEETTASVAEAVRLAPSEPDAHLLAASIAAAQGKFRSAHVSISEVLRIDPQHRQALEYQSASDLVLGKLATGTLTTIDLVRLDPANTEHTDTLRLVASSLLSRLQVVCVIAFVITRQFFADATLSPDQWAIRGGVVATVATIVTIVQLVVFRRALGSSFRPFVESVVGTDPLLAVRAVVLGVGLVSIAIAAFLAPASAQVAYGVVAGSFVVATVLWVVSAVQRRLSS